MEKRISRLVGAVWLLAAWTLGGPLAAQHPRPERARVVEPASQTSGEKRAGTDVDALQQTPIPTREPPVFQEVIQVAEVLIDVLVTDREGRVVTGLGPDDFVVYEEGRMVRPESVTFYGDPASLQASGSGRSDRFFVFFFHHEKDQSTFQRSAQNRMARDAQKWLERELRPNDQVAVLSFDFDLWLHQDFTRDRTRISEAVDNAARGKPTRDSRGDPAPRRVPSTARSLDDSPSLFANLPRGSEFRRQTRTFQEALEMVAKGSRDVIGRKNMLLFSSGFGQVAGIGELHADSQIYKRLERTLNTSNVAVYGFDVLGIKSGDPQLASYGSLAKLSYETGGRYFERDTDFLEPLRRVAAESTGYYLISYRSTYQRGDSGYREVEVGTPRGAYFVRGRKGYLYGRSAF
jgi:VWFA-related protein